MKAVLICPSAPPAVALLAESQPLAAAPLLGECLLTYWLAHLAASGVERVWVLAQDRPEAILEVAGSGARWGLKVEVSAESRELTPGEAWLKFSAEAHPALSQENIVVMDHLPGRARYPMFESYGAWLAELLAWMPKAVTPDRVGVREVAPGVWTGVQARIARRAVLHGPCWIGAHALVGPGAVVGPGAIVEDGAVIEREAEVRQSYVGRDTLAGRYTRLERSIATGNLLIDWQTNSWTRVPDPFLLCALRTPAGRSQEAGLAAVPEPGTAAKAASLVPWKHLLMNKEG